MILHNEREAFENVILGASEHFKLNPVIVEKDYYVTLFLKELVSAQPNVVFRGGTSLSKCYHLINRFSEDIDLNIDCGQKPTEGQRKNLICNIKSVIANNNFDLLNENDILSRRCYNRFEINVNSIFLAEYVKQGLIVETSLFTQSYPYIQAEIDSYIYNYLIFLNRRDIIYQYGLEPYVVNVQSLERTFVDKIFAVCDYYLDANIKEHSRHLYDLYKLSDVVVIDHELISRFNQVKRDRQQLKYSVSAREGVNIKECLIKIYLENIYRDDYEEISSRLIFDNVSYEMVIENLLHISESILFN